VNRKYAIGTAIGAAIVVIIAVAYLGLNGGGYGSRINGLIAKNVEAKGGEDAWSKVSSLQMSGMMSLGQGVNVPYTIDQKRPLKMCMEYEFDKRRVVQCIDGDSGWQFLPYTGRNVPEAMSKEDARAMADTASIDGMLLNAYDRGIDIKWLGEVDVNDRPADKLKLMMPGGSVRWLYLDKETGLETKLEYTRMIRGKEHVVESRYSNWKAENGLLFPGRTDTQIVGDTRTQFLVVDKIIVNPALEEKRFEMPVYNKPVS
jgi:cold shock CspA family protein